MVIKWAIQNNLGNSGDVEKLKDSLTALNIPFELIKVIPFSDDPPEVSNNEPTIFYGSTTLTKNVHSHGRWNPGVWFDPLSYQYENVLKGFNKENLLNGDSEVIPVKTLLARCHFNFYKKDKSPYYEFYGVCGYQL